MRDQTGQDGPGASSSVGQAGPRSGPERARRFLRWCVGVAIAGSLLGGITGYLLAAGKPWSKFWGSVWLGIPAELAGALGATLLYRLTARQPAPSAEALMRRVIPVALISGIGVSTLWQLVWASEVVAGLIVAVTATIFGMCAGAFGGFVLLVAALVCIYD